MEAAASKPHNNDSLRPKRPRTRCAGEGTVYRRSDGLWVGEASRTERGKRRKTKFYGSTRKEAQAQLDEHRRQNLELSLDAHTATVKEALTGWLAEHKANVRSSTYERSDKAKLELHVLPLLGDRKLRSLTPADVHAALAQANVYVGTGKRGEPPRRTSKPLSQRSRQMVWGLLSQALDWAVANRLLALNPLKVRGANRPKVQRRTMRAWTCDELRSFLHSTEGQERHALWVLLGLTGLRISEALGLQWSDVDLTAGTLNVSHQLLEDGALGALKTSNSRRYFRLSEEVVSALKELKQEGTFVFQTSSGLPFSRRNVSREFARAIGKAGLPLIRLHDLRHTNATLLLEAGLPVHVVAQRLGHSSTVLLSTYAHVLRNADERAAEAMSKLLLRATGEIQIQSGVAPSA
jgi:integrase